MRFSVHLKDLSFMAHLLLTQISFTARLIFKKNAPIFPGAVLEVVSFLPWVSALVPAQGQELGAGVEPAPLAFSCRKKGRKNSAEARDGANKSRGGEQENIVS